MNRISLFFLIILFSLQAIAQEKQLNMALAVRGQYRELAPANLQAIVARTGTNQFTYLVNYNTMVLAEAKSDKTENLLTLDQLNTTLKVAGIEAFPYIYDYKWLNANTLLFINGNTAVWYDVVGKNVVASHSAPQNAKNMSVHAESKAIAYTIENNLYVKTLLKEYIVTKDRLKTIVNGDAYVHRQEFGINKGIFWSPDGSKLAFYRKDETMVTDYPLVNMDARIAESTPVKYPMAGMTSEEVTLGVFDLASEKTVFMKTGEPKEQYLTAISWNPTSSQVFIGVLNRGQNHLKMSRFNANSGDFEMILFEEKNDRWVEPENPLRFIPGKNNEFLWLSERDGYNHYYHYNTDGKLLKQVTKGNWIVTELESFDTKGENIIVETTEVSPIERHWYKINLKSGVSVKLTADAGMHKVVTLGNAEFFVDAFSNTQNPNQIDIREKKGKLVRNVLKADNPLKDYKLGKMTVGTLKAADGKTDLYYRLITPPDFDATKKYPAIIYVYGGPHLQQVTNSWLAGVNLWQFLMAQKGYVMLVVDNRGTADRGFEFESVIHRQLGISEMEDQMKGVELLKSLGYVDMNSIGVHGWSYGGFMTTSLMTEHNDIFKVGVAGGPVIDWKYYEVMYGERYMDTPDENPEGYQKTSLLNKASNLKGNLLIIHGDIDNTVVPQHSLQFLKACVAAKTYPDFLLYVGHEHNVSGMDRIHLMEKITQYFDTYLKHEIKGSELKD